MSKIVGIFNSNVIIDQMLNELNTAGFTKDQVSVLHRNRKDHADSDTDTVEEARTFSTATYPETISRPQDVEMSIDRPDQVTESRSNRFSEFASDGLGHVPSDKVEDRHDVTEKDPTAMKTGAAAGGALGLLAGLAALMIPGIGPILALGPLSVTLAAAAGGAAIGTTAGSIIGALKDEGIPQENAELYDKHFKHGDLFVMVEVDDIDLSNRVASIMSKYSPVMIDTF